MGPTQLPAQWVPGLSPRSTAARMWHWPLTYIYCQGQWKCRAIPLLSLWAFTTCSSVNFLLSACFRASNFILLYVEIKCQLDATEVFIADLTACSTCCGHHYAHRQELKSIIQWLLPVVFRAVVYKLLVWCEAEGYVLQFAGCCSKPEHLNSVIFWALSAGHFSNLQRSEPKNNTNNNIPHL